MAFVLDPKRIKINDDLISDLPSNVIDNIMSWLPFRDAARLCVLSNKWKLIWLSFPYLKLDAQFFREVLSNKMFQCYEFNRIVSSVVFSHGGPISKFFLHIPNIVRAPTQPVNALNMVISESLSTPDIGLVLAHLSRIGIREITLDNYGSSRLKLQSHLFSCLELVELKLCHFEVYISPSFKGFKNITRIELESVTFTGSSFESFVSKCPALETLVFKGLIDQTSVVISARNLKVIEVEGSFLSICLKNCTGLSSVTICPKENVLGEKTSDLVNFLSRSCKLQELNLTDNFFKFLGSPGVHALYLSTFDNLRKLQLSSIPLRSGIMVPVVLHIIKRCPNLDELKISFRGLAPALVQRNYSNPKDASYRLRTVYLMSPTGLDMELRFIEFLLCHAPILEKLYIPSAVNTVPTLASKLLKNLLQFPRASNKAQIIFLDHIP